MQFVALSIQLVPDGTVILHIAFILVMVWVLNRTFFKPINRILEARAKKQGGEFGEAEGILNEAAKKETQYNKALLETRNESYEMVEKERANAVATRQKMIADAKAETQAHVEAEKAELQTNTTAAKAELQSEAAKLADKIAANILKA